MAFSEDLSDFFDTVEGFAVNATFSGGSADGIFDLAYAEELGVAGNLPIFTCAAADVSTVSLGDTLTVDGTAYTVKESQPDGTGVTQLFLEAQ